MILEHALLPVKAGQGAAFEQAMHRAKAIIASTPGFRRMSVSRGVETPGTYLLLVEWDTVEDHTGGFRGSTAYEEWRSALHHFYDPFPVVEHFDPVVAIDKL